LLAWITHLQQHKQQNIRKRQKGIFPFEVLTGDDLKSVVQRGNKQKHPIWGNSHMKFLKMPVLMLKSLIWRESGVAVNDGGKAIKIQKKLD